MRHRDGAGDAGRSPACCRKRPTALLAALRRAAPAVGAADAVGIFETFSVASSLLAADAAAKAAQVEVAELRLADGLGGKAYFVVAGEQADVEAAHVRRRARRRRPACCSLAR